MAYDLQLCQPHRKRNSCSRYIGDPKTKTKTEGEDSNSMQLFQALRTEFSVDSRRAFGSRRSCDASPFANGVFHVLAFPLANSLSCRGRGRVSAPRGLYRRGTIRNAVLPHSSRSCGEGIDMHGSPRCLSLRSLQGGPRCKWSAGGQRRVLLHWSLCMGRARKMRCIWRTTGILGHGPR